MRPPLRSAFPAAVDGASWAVKSVEASCGLATLRYARVCATGSDGHIAHARCGEELPYGVGPHIIAKLSFHTELPDHGIRCQASVWRRRSSWHELPDACHGAGRWQPKSRTFFWDVITSDLVTSHHITSHHITSHHAATAVLGLACTVPHASAAFSFIMDSRLNDNV
eukprot:352672-Chlamydomonas_euryale.AAC.11